jgi:hypothetical protein
MRPIHEIEYDLEQAEARLEATQARDEFATLTSLVEDLRAELAGAERFVLTVNGTTLLPSHSASHENSNDN